MNLLCQYFTIIESDTFSQKCLQKSKFLWYVPVCSFTYMYKEFGFLAYSIISLITCTTRTHDNEKVHKGVTMSDTILYVIGESLARQIK